jgi:hypothetical protein
MNPDFKHFMVGIVIQDHTELNEWVIGDRYRGMASIFSMKYREKILEVLKHDKWGISLIQVNELTSRYMIDIYVDDETHYAVIAAIINQDLLQYTIMDIMAQRPFAGFPRENPG